jgi:hypothetical protein
VNLYKSTDQHGNWLECIRSRQQPIAPVEVAHRRARLPPPPRGHELKRSSTGPRQGALQNDDEANALLSRPQRSPYTMA